MSNPESTTTQPQSTATSPLRSFISRLRHTFSQLRPWSEFFDHSTFSRPHSLSESVSRFRKNLVYFRINYKCLILVILARSLSSSPFYLVILLSLIFVFIYHFHSSDQPLVVCGRTFSGRETLLMLIVFTFVVLVLLTNVQPVLSSAFLLGWAIIFVHGVFRVPGELIVRDQEVQANAEVLSFLGETALSAAGDV